MPTYLLTWNPDKWEWPDLPTFAAASARGERITERWTTGTSRKIAEGDRVFLLRQGREPRGIVASGRATSGVYEAEHWQEEDRTALYVDVEFDALLDPASETILSRDRLDDPELAEVHWDPQMSGTAIPEDPAVRLEYLWGKVLHENGRRLLLPDKRSELASLFSEFEKEYLKTDTGRWHMDKYEETRRTGRENYDRVLALDEAGEDITEAVLLLLLPHNDTANNRERGAWMPVAPAITKDIKSWYEAAGHFSPDEWPEVARAIWRFVRRAVEQPEELTEAVAEFEASGFGKGFQAGMLTPILNAVRPDEFVLGNNKSAKSLRYLTGRRVGTHLSDYPELNGLVRQLARELANDLNDARPGDLSAIDLLDMMGHWLWTTDRYSRKPVAPPLDRVFGDRGEAEWGFDLLEETLRRLGVESPANPRFSLSFGPNVAGRGLRLNFGKWMILDFWGRGARHEGVHLALLKAEGEALGFEPSGDDPDWQFAVEEGGPAVAHYQFAVEAVRKSEELIAAFERTLDVVAERFGSWKGSPYRHAHVHVLAEAVFDPDVRTRLLTLGLEEVEAELQKDAQQIQLDEALLARAVTETIRPILIDEGHLADGNREGFHHQRIFPETIPLLAPDSIRADPIGSVMRALHAHVTLLSAYELMKSKTLLEHDSTSPEEVRDRVLDLLYGSDDLAERVDRFVEWGAPRKRDDGANMEMNGTVASYLLAVSQPERYAFCKPSIYHAAAKALVGEALDSTRPGARVAHTTALYQRALTLFRDVHGLPFTDLMHVHIAFYVVAKRWGHPGWNELAEPDSIRELSDALQKVLEADTGVEKDQLLHQASELMEVAKSITKYGPLEVEVEEQHGVSAIAFGEEAAANWDAAGPRVAFVFPGDSSAVYLALLDGRTKGQQGSNPRGDIPELAEAGFTLGETGSLPEIGGSAIALKRYERDRLPADVGLLRDLDAVLNAWQELARQAVPAVREADPAARAEIERDVVGRLLLSRLCVILYGPPGTGKTRRSLQLDRLWRQWQGDGSVQHVTFHPSYAYEDFIEGFRPDENGQFRLQKGAFLRLCEKAHARPERQYLLVIDEINRGDVARIFGELVTLLEKDKRIEHAARGLPYSGEPFWIPKNVHLLGTMNTADRSISLMDIAIRRRFAFVEMQPEPDVLRSAAGFAREVGGIPFADLLDALNRRLSDAGVDHDRSLGHSFFLVEADGVEELAGFRTRIRYDIIPIVEEYCYADRRRMREILGDLVDERGRPNDTIITDDERFVTALQELVGGGRG